MILLLVNQLLVNRVAKIEIQIKLFIENVEKFHNCLKTPFFWPENKTPFYRFVSDPVSDPVSDRFRIRIRIRIQNVYFGSGSDPDPAKSFGSLRIRFRKDPQHCCYSLICRYVLRFFKIILFLEGDQQCLCDPGRAVCPYEHQQSGCSAWSHTSGKL
jgi:hypothetical protein